MVVVGNDPTMPYGTGLQSAHDPYVSTQPCLAESSGIDPQSVSRSNDLAGRAILPMVYFL